MFRTLSSSLKDAWSATCFSNDDITLFARKLTDDEARQGLIGMSLIMICLSVVEALLFQRSGLGSSAIYTCLLLGLLAAHILVSARATRDARSLYLLGTTLLMISGTAFVLLAHNTGAFNFALFASVTLLFMVIPVVPWGLREAMLVLFLIYGTFTVSTWSHSQSFDAQTLWSLQFIMLGAGTISLAMVTRNTCVRKADIRTRYDLEQANRKMMYLSNKDPLTGAWNRRFLKNEFDKSVQAWHEAGVDYHFAFVDIDDFKPMNDNCGHEYGDEVLRCLSSAFTDAVEGHGHFIRMGGDEFAVLFSADDPQAVLTGAHIALNTSKPVSAQCKKLSANLSIGLLSVPPGVDLTLAAICREADQVLYQAKDRKEEYRGRVNIIQAWAEQGPNRQGSAA
jgi:diguanylate cyclase (GGDEF)-like protein